ncbi:MAG: hypothetical protein M1358_25935, partial [Chloroflexi bacterium]|nr:hypothetical protein [Chloroflexota bacterium]
MRTVFKQLGLGLFPVLLAVLFVVLGPAVGSSALEGAPASLSAGLWNVPLLSNLTSPAGNADEVAKATHSAAAPVDQVGDVDDAGQSGIDDTSARVALLSIDVPSGPISTSIPGFSVDLTAFGAVPSARIPLDRWLQHRFKVRYSDVVTDPLGVEIDFSARSSTGTSVTPTQELPAFPQPNRLYLSTGEEQVVTIFLDEIWGEIKGQPTPFPPGVLTRTVSFNFSANIGGTPYYAQVPVTYIVTTLDQSAPITGSYLVQGTVIDNLGAPASGTSVVLGTGTYSRNTVTGPDGWFSFLVPPHPNWALSASKTGYGPAFLDVGTVLTSPAPVSVTLALNPSVGFRIAATETATVTTSIGFWRGIVSSGEDKVLLTNGMENWSDPSLKPLSTLYLYNLDGTPIWSRGMGWESWGADLSDDGSLAAYVNEKNVPADQEQGKVRVIDVTTNTPLWTRAYTDSVFNTTTGDLVVSKEARFSHSGQYLAVGSGNGDVFLLSSGDGTLAWRHFTEGQVRKILWSSDDQYLYVGSGDGRLYKLRAGDGVEDWASASDIWSWPFTYGLALSPDGSRIAVGTKTGWLTVISTASGAVLWTFDMDGTVSWLDWSPDGQHLVAGGGGNQSVSLFTADGTRLWRSGVYSQSGRFSQDGSYVMAQSGGNLFFYSLSAEQLGTIPTSIRGGGQFAYLNNAGDRIVAAARDMVSGTVGISFLEVATTTVAASPPPPPPGGNGPDLSGSEKRVSPGPAQPGDVVTYTIRLSNKGNQASPARITDVLPAGVTYVAGSLSTTAFGVANFGLGAITWDGSVLPGEVVTFTWRARVDDTPPVSGKVTNTVQIDDGAGHKLSRVAVLNVGGSGPPPPPPPPPGGGPDLSASFKSVQPHAVKGGDVFTYSIRVVNLGGQDAVGARVTDVIPFPAAMISGSLRAKSGSVGYAGGTVYWSGTVTAGAALTVAFRATVSEPSFSGPITNTAQIDDGNGHLWSRSERLFIGSGGGGPPPGPPPPGGGGGQVSGAVLSSAGDPVANAQVDVRMGEYGPPVSWASSDGAGNFTASGLITGSTYLIKASAPEDSTDADSEAVSFLFPDTTRITLTLRIPALSGVVRDPSNTVVITDANVELRTNDRMGQQPLHLWANTKSNGTFAFAGLDPDTYFVRANPMSGSEYSASPEQMVVYTGTTLSGIALNLSQPALTGTVTAPDMVTPVPFTGVTLHSKDYRVSSFGGTDAQGRFSIGGVADGEYIIEAYPPMQGGSPYSQSRPEPITITGGLAVGISRPFILSLTTASITGTVLAPDLVTPISRTHVMLRSADYSFQSHSQTDDSGTFQFGGVDPGTYVIEADPPPMSQYSRSLPQAAVVASGVTSYYTVTLTMPSLSGTTVKVSGGITVPVPRAGIDVRMLDNPAVAYFSGSNEQGQFSFGGLPAGVYWLSAHTPWEATGLVAPAQWVITITEGVQLDETVVFEQATKHIAGKVVRSTGAVVTDAMVFANRDNGAGWANDLVNDQGRFIIDVAPGVWMVNVGADMGGPEGRRPAPTWTYGRPPTRVELPDGAGEITRTVVFTVTDASSRIQGRLLKPDGNPPTEAGIGFHSGAGFGSGGPVERDGSFSVSLPAGTYYLDVWLRDSTLIAPRLDAIVLGDGDVRNLGTITLGSKTSRITGAVVDSNGRGISGVEVGAWTRRTDGPEEGPGGGWANTTSITDGVFSLYVISGTWEVASQPAPGSRYVQSGPPTRVFVASDDTTVSDVDIVVTAADAEISGSVVDENGTPLSDLYGFASAHTSGSMIGPGPGYGAPINGGTFTIRLPSGTYDIEGGTPPGSEYNIGRRSTVVISETTNITLTATRARAGIAGALLGSGGTPLTGLRANVFAGGPQGMSFTQVDGDTGMYSMRVVSGTWFVACSNTPSSGYTLDLSGDNRIEARDGLTTTFDFTVTSASSKIWGVVTDPDGTPVGGAWVEVRRSGDEGRDKPPFGTDTDSSGVYTATLPSGNFNLSAFLPPDRGFLPPTVMTATINNGEVARRDLQFRRPGATLSGSVTLGGAPVSAGFVRAYSAGGARAYSDVASSGTYSLPVTTDDIWHIQAVREYSSVLYQSPVYDLVITSTSKIQDLALSSGTTLPDSTSVSFDASTMRVINLADGTEIRIPAGALAVSGTVTVRAVPKGTVAMDGAARPIGLAYDLAALDSSGATISSFRQNVAIVLHYTDEQLAALGITENQVMGSYWDSATGTWRRASNMVQDRSANTLTLYSDHFSSWSITGGSSAPNLATSQKTASESHVRPGQTITYTVAIINSGDSDANVVMTDPLPIEITYVPGSATSSSGSAPTYSSGALGWTGTVSAARSVAVTFRATLDPSTVEGQVVTNSAAIDFGTGTIVDVSTSITASIPNLSTSTKTPASASVPPGRILTYTISLINAGQATAWGAGLTDTLPVGLNLVSGTLTSTSGSPLVSNGQPRWTGSISAGSRVTVTYQAGVDATLPNGAVLTSSLSIYDGYNPTISTPSVVTVTAPYLAGSSKAVSSAAPRALDVSTYTIRIVNSGDYPAMGALVTDRLPSSVAYITGTEWSSSGSTNWDGTDLTWNGDVSSGGVVTVTVAARVPGNISDGTVITNSAVIYDGMRSVVTATATSTATAAPVLSTSTKSVSSPTARAGDLITYTISLTNTGGMQAIGVRVTDTLPVQVTYQSASSSSGASPIYSSGMVMWYGDVAQAASVTLRITGRVTTTVSSGSIITNTAT